MSKLRIDSGSTPRAFFNEQDEREDHGGGSDNGRTDKNRFRGGFEGVAGAVIFFQVLFANIKVAV